MKRILGLSALVSVMFISATTVQAAGFQLNEYSAAGMGRSFAGAGVVGDDFSAIGYNPAGMSLNETSGVQFGGSMVSVFGEYKGDNGYGIHDTGDTRITRVMPNGFAQYKLNDRATIGLGIYIPFGLATDYKNGWYAESHGGLSQITTLNFSPSFSYQLHDMLAIGGSLNIQHAAARITGRMKTVSQNLEGDGWATGYSLGLVFKPIEGVRLGASYRSKSDYHLKGKIKVDGYPSPVNSLNRKYSISADLTTPETVTLSGAFDLTNRLTMSATARWTRWSRFEYLDVVTNEDFHSFIPTTGLVTSPAGSKISSTYENWKNTWFYSVGADYKVNDQWTVRVGGAYDETVIKSPEYRTVRIPDGRRIWTSLGFSYTHQNIQLDVGYSHIFVHGGEAKGGDSAQPKPDMKYSSNADMFSMGLQYNF